MIFEKKTFVSRTSQEWGMLVKETRTPPEFIPARDMVTDLTRWARIWSESALEHPDWPLKTDETLDDALPAMAQRLMKEMRAASGTLPTVDALTEAVVARIQAGVAAGNVERPDELTEAEVRAIKPADEAVSRAVLRAYIDLAHDRITSTQEVLPDPKVDTLRTDADFLNYNTLYVGSDSVSTWHSSTPDEVPDAETLAKIEDAMASLEAREIYAITRRPGDDTVVGYLIERDYGWADESFTDQALLDAKGNVVWEHRET
jgi:hypothetical protein